MCCYLPFKSALTDWPLTFDAVKHNKFLEFKHFNHVFSQSENYVVPRRGLEPPRPCGHRFLKPARLPIPPPRHIESILYQHNS